MTTTQEFLRAIESPGRMRRIDLRAALAICLGAVVTLCVYGYQFGRGNHAVYLVDAIRRAQPPALANDWFTTQTFQYHFVFTRFTEVLIQLGCVQAGFAISYVLLIVLFHIAWQGIVRELGGDDVSYLVSVVLYYLSAAGTALGMYQFFQDSSLLPSNIAAVAMLAGIWLWIAKRFGWAGACFGISGFFHLNFALVGVALWVAMCAWRKRIHRAGTAAAILPSVVNIAIAAHLKLARSGAMPLEEFVELYVRLRHPHHYDPSTWPIGIWIAFGWAAVAAIALLRGDGRRIVVLFLMMIAISLVGAGIWYFNETLIQMSLYRFSIYVQLLGCVAFGIYLTRTLNRKQAAVVSIGACAAISVVCALRGPFFGAFRMPRDDADYVALCRWVDQNTPLDATFIVPPDEESMRVIGRRAIVVNYKGVPQLSSGLMQWRDRMRDLLALQDLTTLPHGYARTLPAIRERYDQLSAGQIIAIAKKYDARYVITAHPLADLDLLLIHATGPYMLYDLQRPGGKEQRQ